MIQFDFDEWCCGCTSCANACPVDAISMQRNEEGFLMPVVDQEKCIDCEKCNKSCPHLNISEDVSAFSMECFKDKPSYLYFSNKEERKNSASGGFVYDAMRRVVDSGGYACGCVWDENLKATHIVSDQLQDLYRMQSSKYVQSSMAGCYMKIDRLLKEGKSVVFCGTPCQTAGLKHFLRKKSQDNLISICLICHGVASPLVWEKWKKVVEKKYKGKLVDVNMRDKSYKGYSTSYSKYTLERAPRAEGKKCGHASHECGNFESTYLAERSKRNVGMPTYLADPYIFLFTDDLFLRNSCYHCQYKADQNGADVIVGDFYESMPKAGNMGCSCLLAMTEKGDRFITSLDGSLINSNYATIGKVNSMLWKSVNYNPKRSLFFDKMYSKADGDSTLFTDFLPLRFKVKKMMNQLGLFNAYLVLKRKAIRLLK